MNETEIIEAAKHIENKYGSYDLFLSIIFRFNPVNWNILRWEKSYCMFQFELLFFVLQLQWSYPTDLEKSAGDYNTAYPQAVRERSDDEKK